MWKGSAAGKPSHPTPHPRGQRSEPGALRAHLHPVGTQMLPLFSPLALTFPVLCVNPFYFPFSVAEASGWGRSRRLHWKAVVLRGILHPPLFPNILTLFQNATVPSCYRSCNVTARRERGASDVSLPRGLKAIGGCWQGGLERISSPAITAAPWQGEMLPRLNSWG